MVYSEESKAMVGKYWLITLLPFAYGTSCVVASWLLENSLPIAIERILATFVAPAMVIFGHSIQ